MNDFNIMLLVIGGILFLGILLLLDENKRLKSKLKEHENNFVSLAKVMGYVKKQ